MLEGVPDHAALIPNLSAAAVALNPEVAGAGLQLMIQGLTKDFACR